jgi:hypothetical protein
MSLYHNQTIYLTMISAVYIVFLARAAFILAIFFCSRLGQGFALIKRKFHGPGSMDSTLEQDSLDIQKPFRSPLLRSPRQALVKLLPWSIFKKMLFIF